MDPVAIVELRRAGLGFRTIARELSRTLGTTVHRNTIRSVWRAIGGASLVDPERGVAWTVNPYHA